MTDPGEMTGAQTLQFNNDCGSFLISLIGSKAQGPPMLHSSILTIRNSLLMLTPISGLGNQNSSSVISLGLDRPL